MLNAAAIEATIIRLLAEDARVTEAEERGLLEAAGPQLPIDSLLLAEIIVRLETELGWQAPNDADTASTMGSVSAFACRLAESAPVARTAASSAPAPTA